ncbi:hypothetical protein [Haloferula sp. BvORR071]|uniref:hypothetical protein n=1 Tax=Haloferula sp. BvORR071 TaxID=1396141 RepID=UPI0005534042|nr:hypothetical protein [Haloferula sp. BvORR071]
MKRKTKILGLSAAGCFGLLGLGALVVVLGVLGLFSITGRPYFDTPRDKAALRSICTPYRDIPAAIEVQRKALGRYPKELANFDPLLPGAKDALRILRSSELVYSCPGDDPDQYSLYDKLNWDGALVYKSSDPRWVYDAGFGDGTGIWPID